MNIIMTIIMIIMIITIIIIGAGQVEPSYAGRELRRRE